MTIMAPRLSASRSRPRDPLLRLQTLLRSRQRRAAHERDKSRRARRIRHRQRCADHRVLHRQHRHGRRHGRRGCRHIVDAIDDLAGAGAAIVGCGTPVAPGWPRAYGSRRGRPGVRRDGPRLRLVPQISVVVSFAAGGAAYERSGVTDVVIMAPESWFKSPDRTSCAASPARTSTGGSWRADTRTTASPVVPIVRRPEADAYARPSSGRIFTHPAFDRSIPEAGDVRPPCSPSPPAAPTTCPRSLDRIRRSHRGNSSRSGRPTWWSAWAGWRPHGRRGRQQPAAPGRLPDSQSARRRPGSSGCTRVRHPAAGHRGRPRLPAGRRPEWDGWSAAGQAAARASARPVRG